MALERRSADVERGAPPFDKADDARDRRLERHVRADKLGYRELVLKVANESVRIVAEKGRADALVRGGDQDPAERAQANGEADGRAAPAVLIGARAMPSSRGLGVEAARGVVTRVVDRLRYACRFCERARTRTARMAAA